MTGPSVYVTHLTTASTLLDIGSMRILTDPVFDSGRKTYHFVPGASATRYVGPPVDPADLPPLDAVLLSHAHHADNFDDAGKKFVERAASGGAAVITGKKSSQRAGTQATRLARWQETEITAADGFRVRVTAVPARHGPWYVPHTSHVVGFVLQWEAHDGALYISGDTVYYRGIRQIAERFQIAVAIMHLGGVHFWPPYPSRLTFTARQAAKAACCLKPEVIIPIHYEQSVWSHFRETLSDYKAEFGRAGLTSKVRWLKPGVRTLIDGLK